MNWVKGFALVTCLATPLSVSATVSASADPIAAGSTSEKVAAISDPKIKAKAADCTKKATEKKLHGEERRKFRSECMKEG